MSISELRPWSLGLVSKVKPLGTHAIVAIPIEMRLLAQEEVIEGETDETSTFATTGGEDNVRTVSGNSVEATWLKINTTRKSAPDVRRNDLVQLYKLGNDKYYWTDMDCKNVKRLETVLYAISADPNGPMREDMTNAYFIEWSSHNKTLTLHTSQANGEPFGYDIQVNADDGIIRTIDTAGNTTYLDSANTCIGAKNALGTWFNLDKKNIRAYAPDSMYVKAENLIEFKCKDFKIDASNSISFNTKTYKLEASASITTKTTTFKATANSNTFDCPSTVFTGNVAAANINVGGAGRSGGGNCMVSGALTANSIKCSSINGGTAHFNKLTHDGPKCC